MYIPKNRIITDLKTTPNEFVYKGTNTFYNGFYWKSYDGKIYIGKNPNDVPTREIEKYVNIQDSDTFTSPPIQSQILFTDIVEPFIGSENNIYSEELVIDYSIIKKINLNQPDRKFLPFQYYPTPTQDDYNLGVFPRYFVVKANENIYLEVNKDTYDSINNQSPDWAWELYTPFSILWTLTGERDAVFITNRNITQLTEQRLKRRGLQEFLKSNYLKFYKTDEEKNIS
jgi:hypothetical protein